ncbi:MAG: hypothetical protein R3B49_06060 [Phycisphaerales bacterium]
MLLDRGSRSVLGPEVAEGGRGPVADAVVLEDLLGGVLDLRPLGRSCLLVAVVEDELDVLVLEIAERLDEVRDVLDLDAVDGPIADAADLVPLGDREKLAGDDTSSSPSNCPGRRAGRAGCPGCTSATTPARGTHA